MVLIKAFLFFYSLFFIQPYLLFKIKFKEIPWNLL